MEKKNTLGWISAHWWIGWVKGCCRGLLANLQTSKKVFFNHLTLYVQQGVKWLYTNLYFVLRRHGKLLEEGASGFLQKKLAADGSKEIVVEHSELEWSSLNKILSEGTTEGRTSFGSKNWASVYLASTPQQAAEMGLKFPGVDEVLEL